MAKKPLPCPTLLRQLLRYEPETGKLFWKPRAEVFFHTPRASRLWNAKMPGRLALTALDAYGYPTGSVLYKSLKAHRVAWAIHYGYWPNIIDHINGIRHDNRIDNLRDVGKRENSLNSKRRLDCTSGHRGVSFDRARSLWRAHINKEGKQISLGRFETRSEAVAARKKASEAPDVRPFAHPIQ